MPSIPLDIDANEPAPNWGHWRLGNILSKYAAPINDYAPVIAQSSGIGYLNGWTGQILDSLWKDSDPEPPSGKPKFKFIYPSMDNVANGLGGVEKSGWLPYRPDVHGQQTWLENHCQQWVAERRHRTKAIPHMKTYFRYSMKQGLYWFCLSSCNFSRGAWGQVKKKVGQYCISNWEMGILFLPTVMIGQNTFPLYPRDHPLAFPMPYDIPLVGYRRTDRIFVQDHVIGEQ